MIYPPLKELFPDAVNCQHHFGKDWTLSSYRMAFDSLSRKINVQLELTQEQKIDSESYVFLHFFDAQENLLFQGDLPIESTFHKNPIIIKSQALSKTRWLLDRSVFVPETVSGFVSVRMGIWKPKLKKQLKLNDSEKRVLVLGNFEISHSQ